MIREINWNIIGVACIVIPIIVLSSGEVVDVLFLVDTVSVGSISVNALQVCTAKATSYSRLSAVADDTLCLHWLAVEGHK